MNITQGYKSKSLGAFRFLEMHQLRPYDDKKAPLVVFGCYSKDDIRVIQQHQYTVIIQWCGLDSKAHKDYSVFRANNIINVTPQKNIKEYLDTKGVRCSQIRWVIDDTLHSAQILGERIYAYVNKKNPAYYGSDVIKKLKTNYPIIIGDYSVPASQWPKDEYYSQCFIGLQLSEYAGGGMSIVEMGLRGLRVVTNILDLPHTIPWKCTCDIEEAINAEARHIGLPNKGLAEKVYNSVLCAERIHGFDLDELII
jgi:hypothetical protein